jgi:hypothetical protein
MIHRQKQEMKPSKRNGSDNEILDSEKTHWRSAERMALYLGV